MKQKNNNDNLFNAIGKKNEKLNYKVRNFGIQIKSLRKMSCVFFAFFLLHIYTCYFLILVPLYKK